MRTALGQPAKELPAPPDLEQEVTDFLQARVDGRLPFEAVTKLRSKVGREIESGLLMQDVPRSQWKALYSALSDDVRAAADTAGSAAKQAFNRANSYYSARVDRIEAIEHVIDKAGGPEKVYRAAVSGTEDGGTTLRAVMQSLPKEDQRVLASAVLRRMGRAVNSQQNDTGDAFSVQTFLTNWGKQSSEAKAQLFNRFGGSYRMDMDSISRVASNLRKGSAIYANGPGTARALA